MAKTPSSVAAFLAGKRFAVAGVSRRPQQAANAIFRKLRKHGIILGRPGTSSSANTAS